MPSRFRCARPLALAALALAFGAGMARADILIGTAGPLQGQYAALGEQLRRGVQLAVDDVNAAGGVNGEQLVLQIADDGCDPRKAVDVANQFAKAGVKFVAGHYCSGASLPAARIYDTAGILQISPASTWSKLTDAGLWNLLRTCPRDDAQGTVAGAHIAANFPAAKVAILADQTPSNKALAAKVKEALQAKGITGTLFENYQSGGRDYAELAGKLADGKIDVIYLAGAYPEAAAILKQVAGLGRKVQLVSDDALVTDDFWNAAGDLGEGTLMTFPPDPLKNEAARAVIQRFKDQGYSPEGYTLNAYAAVQAYAAAAKATGGTDARRISDWLKAGNGVDTVIGRLAFDPRGDLTAPRFVWLRWSQGKYEELPPAP